MSLVKKAPCTDMRKRCEDSYVKPCKISSETILKKVSQYIY